jgi:site-specific recombinase XerD
MDTPFDYFFNSRTTPTTIAAVRGEPLAAALEGYAQHLRENGYAVHSGFMQLRLLGCFNRWLFRKGLKSADVDSSTIQQYLRGREQSGRLRNGDSATLSALLQFLRPGGSDGPAPPLSDVDCALLRFQDYLRHDRSLAAATVAHYTPIVRSFLVDRFPAGRLHWPQISATGIAAFVRQRAAVVTSKRATVVVSALRSFLHYLFHRGVTKVDMAACVPTIATWSLSNLPKCLPGEQIQKVLDSCDRKNAIGKRDYALLLLLARLGLRAGEVVALRLDDIDWEAGLITVQGKGKRVVQMPLPSEVGSAVADYLSTARPSCASRRVFIRATAPLRGFANSIAICSLVDRALERAGVESKFRGSHLFRHSLASRMLKDEASLPEIGDVLRHRNPDTTRIYAKVDLVSLRSIALPWPGGNQ